MTRKRRVVTFARQEKLVSCKFLGNLNAEHSPVEDEKAEPEPAEKAVAPKIEFALVTCPFCFIEMSAARTKLRIEGNEELHSKFAGDLFLTCLFVSAVWQNRA